MLTEQGFFSEIVSGASTKEEQIIRILKARGFLIDEKDGKYYLSDNAAEDDTVYLSEGLEEFSLGRVIQICHKNISAEIRISHEASLEDAFAFFKQESHISFPIVRYKQPWSKLISHSFGSKVNLRVLEPFVARYVKAVSACGVSTNYSCDGNFPGQDRIKVYADYPFGIWHCLICRYIIPPRLKTEFDDMGEWVFTKGTQYKSYLLLNQAAEYLYDHRKAIRGIKATARETIKTSKLKHLSDEELAELFTKSIEYAISEVPIE